MQITCFNSSKVRLGVISTCKYFELLNVSIPLRCDWEARRQFNSILDWRFNSSKVRLGAALCVYSQAPARVSIPLRCDWESESLLEATSLWMCFNSSKVRLGVRYKSDYSIELWDVSIPLRCDWELGTSLQIASLYCFNSSKVRLGATLPTRPYNTKVVFQFL